MPKCPFDNEARYYDIFHQHKDYAAEAREIRRKFPDAKTVLEIGCGTGNLTVELRKLGFLLTCLDPSMEMLEYHKGGAKYILNMSIQEYPIIPRHKFDLVLATYDALNYVPFDEIRGVIDKIPGMTKHIYAEVWDPWLPVRPLSYKRANGCHRLRVGFKFRYQVYLWYVFWGRGLVISHHHLYLHRVDLQCCNEET